MGFNGLVLSSEKKCFPPHTYTHIHTSTYINTHTYTHPWPFWLKPFWLKPTRRMIRGSLATHVRVKSEPGAHVRSPPLYTGLPQEARERLHRDIEEKLNDIVQDKYRHEVLALRGCVQAKLQLNVTPDVDEIPPDRRAEFVSWLTDAIKRYSLEDRSVEPPDPSEAPPLPIAESTPGAPSAAGAPVAAGVAGRSGGRRGRSRSRSPRITSSSSSSENWAPREPLSRLGVETLVPSQVCSPRDRSLPPLDRSLPRDRSLPPPLRRVSRALSKVLRHRADRYGLKLQPDGFAPLEDVLRAVDVPAERVRRTVKSSRDRDGMPRFELQSRSGGDCWIRATGRHTISGIDAGGGDVPPRGRQMRTRSNSPGMSDRMTRLSRALSSILRHRGLPEGQGQLCADGFAEVGQVAKALRNFRTNDSEVRRVVDASVGSDGRPRFELRALGDKLWIRATGRHTLPVSLAHARLEKTHTHTYTHIKTHTHTHTLADGP